MGNVTYIANSNYFWINNLPEFKEGIKGFVGGEHESDVSYFFSDYKKRSKKALMNMSSEDFSIHVYREDDNDIELNLLEFIKSFIVEGETCIIHEVAYEHAGDMCITKYEVTSTEIKETVILDN